VPLEVAFVRASSYRGASTTSDTLKIHLEDLPAITGRHVLLVDDICDTGETLSALTTALWQHQPASLRTAVLLWKPSRSRVDLQPDHAAFTIANEFVVGYGLDYDGKYRNLPDICVIEE
jgi:hypoxanthine phosphoribosyltransferase